eukprot:714132_1
MFNICSYQQRISVVLCLCFIYYQCFSFDESYKLGQSRFAHDATPHINYLSVYMVSIYEQSKLTIDYYYSQQPTSIYDINAFISLLISSLFIIEILFYCRWKYLMHFIHSNVSMFDCKPTLSDSRRRHLLKMTAKYAELDKGMSHYASELFLGAKLEDIHRDNAIEYLEWSFFSQHDADPTAKSHRQWRTVLNYVERVTGHTFKKGYNPNLSFMQNTSDDRPLSGSTTFRPFVFYLVVLLLQYITDLVFIYVLRFEYRFISGLKVWYRIQSTHTSKPICIVHGLTVAHYIVYIPMIYKICRKSTQNDVICIEIPWTVMSLWHFIPKRMWNWFSDTPSPSYIDSRSPATKQDFVHILQHMEDLILDKSSHTQVLYERTDRNALKLKWTLIGHSYGSFIVSGIYDYIKGGHTRCIDKEINLPRMILLDPVTLCLTKATTVSFLCEKAHDWPTYLLQQIAPRELMIACTLRKYFHWYEYNIFPEDLINAQVEHVVVTATSDTLIPNKLITKGIELVNEKHKGYSSINHISFEGMMHAVWLASPSMVQRVIDVV